MDKLNLNQMELMQLIGLKEVEIRHLQLSIETLETDALDKINKLNDLLRLSKEENDISERSFKKMESAYHRNRNEHAKEIKALKAKISRRDAIISDQRNAKAGLLDELLKIRDEVEALKKEKSIPAEELENAKKEAKRWENIYNDQCKKIKKQAIYLNEYSTKLQELALKNDELEKQLKTIKE